MDPKVNMQLMMNEPRCCCFFGTRIRTGALVMAIIGFIYYAITAICVISFYLISFKTKDGAQITCWLVCVIWIVSLLNFISYLLFIGVMYAVRKDKAWAYLPYLIIQGIGFILSVIYCYIIDHAKFDNGHSNAPSKAVSNRKKVTKMDPKVNMQLMMNEPRCCCGTRIRTGALVVAILGAIFSAIAAISFVIINITSMNSKGVGYIGWSAIPLRVITLLLCIGVMYAAKKDKAWAYLPYLFIQGIGLVVWLILTVWIVIYYILALTAVPTIDTRHSHEGTATKGITTNNGAENVGIIIEIALLLFIAVLESYLYSVIWRAYKFTKDFVEPNRFGQVQRIGVATQRV